MLLVKSFLGFVFASAINGLVVPQPSARTSSLESVFSCGSASDLFVVEAIAMSPPQPKKGDKISVNFKGNLKESINWGAKMDLKIQLSGTTLINKSMDFCSEVMKYGTYCPMAVGAQTINQSFDVPSYAPSVS
jgi:hypothetical protein